MTSTEIVLRATKLPFKGSLHPFQSEDLNTLAPADNCGLYHDLGLGKTTIAFLIGVYKIVIGAFKLCFVICPESLISQWCEVLGKTDVDVLAYRGSPSERAKMNLNKYEFVVMSYQIFQKDYDRLKKFNAFNIVDEATILCNSRNVLWKMFQGGETRKVVPVPGKLKPEIKVTRYEPFNKGAALLTATPINRPEDAYGLIKIVSPEIYTNFDQFQRIHVAESDQYDRAKEYINLDLLKRNLLVNAVQRFKEDHLELPPIIFKTIGYDLDPKHLEFYRRTVKSKLIDLGDGEQVMNPPALYNWSQRLVLCPELAANYTGKEPVGFELLDQLIAAQSKFLVFCKYKDTNRKIMNRYDIGGFYGETTSKEQDEFLSRFKHGDLRGMTLHPKSGGFGLDLPEAKYLNFLEFPVTPRDFRQCCGRAWRQGQADKVTVVVPFARKTIQETLVHRAFDTDDLMSEVVEMRRSLKNDLLDNIEFIAPRSKKEVMKELMGE